jgi:Na+/citrate or Na+/malate symporter
MPPNAETTTIKGSLIASTILLTLKMLFAEPTDVPPNFITFIILVFLLLILEILPDEMFITEDAGVSQGFFLSRHRNHAELHKQIL